LLDDTVNSFVSIQNAPDYQQILSGKTLI